MIIHTYIQNTQSMVCTLITSYHQPSQMCVHAHAGSPAPSDSSNEEESTGKYSYFVRIINPKKKSDYVVRAWHDVKSRFDTPDSLREKLVEHFPDDLPDNLRFKVGYFEGRGSTKRWIFEPQDLETMYSSFDSSKVINLWCEGKSEQEDNSNAPPAKRSRSGVKSTRREQLEEEVDDIFKQLKEKHTDMTAPKLRLWARLIQSGHHDDYDTPPNIPLITGSSSTKSKKESVTDALTGAATAVVKMIQSNSSGPAAGASVSAQISPLKAAQLRRGCLEDLKKVKELLEDNVLSQQEFDEEKKRILGSLKTLK